MLQDLKYAARMVVRQPGYSAVVMITLALAIGANTVIFSFANILLLRPLPLHDPDRITFVWWTHAQRGVERGTLSAQDLLDLRQSMTAVQSLAGTAPASYTLTGRGDATRLSASRVTANLLTTWGIGVAHGRGFVDGEDAPGAAPVVLLSHHYWVRAFESDPSIVGQSLILNGRAHAVVGVLEPDIEFGNLATIDLWTPATLDPAAPRDERFLRVSGRLRPGATVEQADAEVRAIASRLASDHPKTNVGWDARAVSVKVGMTGTQTWTVMALLGVVVGLVLLIACANLANLVLVRASARRKEIAIRAALGAARHGIVRQLVVENLLLGIGGGVSGLLVALAGLRAIRTVSSEPFFQMVTIDANVMTFSAALALLTPVLFTLVPALQSSRADVNEALKDASRGSSGVRGRRSRAALVVSQLTLAVMLLVVASLLVQTMVAMMRSPLGFDPSNVLTLQVEAPEWKYPRDADVHRFWETLLPRLTAVAGAKEVGATTRVPVLDGGASTSIAIDGRAAERDADRPWAIPATITPDYFAAAGIPLRAGRAFAASDGADEPRVAVINEAMARRYWRSSNDALGARIAIAGDGAAPVWRQVVGIAGDVLKADLTGSDPEVYVPLAQQPRRAVTFLVKSDAPSAVAGAIRIATREADPDVAVYQMRTFDEAFEQERTTTAVLVGLFVAFAVLALALAATGLYGVMSYTVSQRVQEIAIRLALGAVPSDISRLVGSQSAVLVVAGSLLGVAGGAGMAQLTRSLLYGISPFDPVTFALVTGLLLLVAIVACAVPVRRAMRVDTVEVLRAE